MAGHLIVEELEDRAAGQVDEGRLDRDAGIADMPCRDTGGRASSASAPGAEEGLPEVERLVEAGDAHADVVNAEAVAVDPGAPAAAAIISSDLSLSDPEEPLGIAREHRRLLALAEAGDDLGIGVDRGRDRS